MNHTHDFTINVLLVQLAFQFVAFMLWLHLSGLDGLRRERIIQLLEQRPIHITRVFREEDSDSEDDDSDDEEDEDFDNDDEDSDDEEDSENDDEDFDHEDGEDDEDDEEDDEDNRSEATVEGDTPAPDAATEEDRTDLGEKKDQ
jgi:hypothetical protein